MQGFINLQARLERMSTALHPLFVTVTWGAGGTTSTKSLLLAEICQRQLGLTTVLHLTCTNMSRRLIDEALREAKSIGIRNILALRGDPPRSAEYNPAGEDDSNTEFEYARHLVRYIRKEYGNYFAIGVAAYPEGHADESHPEHHTPEKDLPYLIEKTREGADFIMTQLTYDVDAYTRFEKMLREHESGLFKTMPIIPGLMPIQSYNNLTRVAKLSHVSVSEDILEQLKSVRADDGKVKQIGVDLLVDIIERIKSLPSPGPRGFHFYTLNLEKSVTEILERCNLLPSTPATTALASLAPSTATAITAAATDNTLTGNKVILDQKDPTTPARLHEITPCSISHSTILTTTTGNTTATITDPHDAILQISEGLGSLGREATWDDFPNGRWGDPRSPAFGEIDGYGPSLHVGPDTARRIWGFPTSETDVSTLFLRHIRGELAAVPWSEGGGGCGDMKGEGDGEGDGKAVLNTETATIREELIELIGGRGWWTLASQPAVNGVRSDDEIFGWGPPGEGFVFQKAFVEFFVTKESYETVLRPLLRRFGEEEITWFSVNAAGEFASSSMMTTTIATDESSATRPCSPQSPSSTSIRKSTQNSNAVTWGVFRGKEIITPTIIEEVSFKAWGEEAFRIWDEWRLIFPPGSATEKFLGRMKKDVYLRQRQRQQQQTGRIRAALSKLTIHLPASLRKHAIPLQNAPISHALSFLILHELTAVIPLFGLVGVFEYTGWLPSISGGNNNSNSQREGGARDGSDMAVNHDDVDGSKADVQMFETWLKRRGWIRDEQQGHQGGVDGEEVMEGTMALSTKGKATGKVHRLVLEFATAYAITKLLLPVRVIVSVWATPWFARSVVVPVRDVLSRMTKVIKSGQ
ncbi:hypothetical protein KEM54_004006 [Ascosphaera aggregata]|nr:hypothetical protein KEM54_004006 [Ascosphaera aggregata]